MSARLLFEEKGSLIHAPSLKEAIVEIKIWEIPVSDCYPEGIKFSLFLVWEESGQVILGLDNHAPKGPHMHYRGQELAYDFRETDAMIEEFWELVRMEGFDL